MRCNSVKHSLVSISPSRGWEVFLHPVRAEMLRECRCGIETLIIRSRQGYRKIGRLKVNCSGKQAELGRDKQ